MVAMAAVSGVRVMGTLPPVIGVHLVPGGGGGRRRMVVVMLLAVVHWRLRAARADTPHQYARSPHRRSIRTGCR